MKKAAYFFVCVLMVFSACQPSQKGFTIKGQLDGIVKAPLIVSIYGKDGLEVFDTLEVKDGMVDYHNELPQPLLVLINMEGRNDRLVFFGENTAYTIKGHVDSLSITKLIGGPLNNAYQAFVEQQEKAQLIKNNLGLEYKTADEANDSTLMKQLVARYDSLTNSLDEAQRDYVELNPASPLAAFFVSNLYGHKELVDLRFGLSMLDTTLSVSPYYMRLAERIASLERVEVGQVAPDFTLADKDGKTLSLSSLRGKYVLIDFWASWCAPCRQENPNVVKMYTTYKDKGFDVLGVSLDQTKPRWIKAIEDDGLLWNQVSDLKGWSSDVAKMYGVSSIPYSFLVDANGVIVAKNLRGKELADKLKEIFVK